MYNVLIMAASYVLLMGVVTLTYVSDLRQAKQTADTVPNYCIEPSFDYSLEKCNKIKRWWRLEEEIFIRKSIWEENCKCPKKEQSGFEKPAEKVDRLFCEETCGQADHSLEITFRKYCHPESSDFNKKICEDDPLYKWLTNAKWHMKERSKGEEMDKEKCNCPSAPDSAEDPLHRWNRLQCENECKNKN